VGEISYSLALIEGCGIVVIVPCREELELTSMGQVAASFGRIRLKKSVICLCQK
jgi:hypothetical protein